MSERQFWIGFNMVAGVGPVRFRQLLEQFGALSEAWRAPEAALRQAGLDRRTLGNLAKARRSLNLAAELARLDRLGIAVLTWDDEDYPALLRQLHPIDDAPPVLYMRGTLTVDDEWALAVVGTRQATAYGRQVTYRLASELAANRLTIVSGLAHGIDSEAHLAALDAGGRTIAVLPCGLDTVYPPENRGLAARIIQQGALLTPFPLGTQAERKYFAPRNRVISGLARGVLVTEAGDKSGALLTAGCALEQGREVFAVPGNITAKGSSGANNLVRDGAHPVLEAADVLGVLNLEQVAQHHQARISLPDMTGDEQLVLEGLSDDPVHIDELVQRTGLPVQVVNSTLTMLELKGVARQVSPMVYVRNR